MAMSALVGVEKGNRKVTCRVSCATLFRRFWLANLEKSFCIALTLHPKGLDSGLCL
jgi:hypothetical protein